MTLAHSKTVSQSWIYLLFPGDKILFEIDVDITLRPPHVHTAFKMVEILRTHIQRNLSTLSCRTRYHGTTLDGDCCCGTLGERLPQGVGKCPVRKIFFRNQVTGPKTLTSSNNLTSPNSITGPGLSTGGEDDFWEKKGGGEKIRGVKTFLPQHFEKSKLHFSKKPFMRSKSKLCLVKWLGCGPWSMIYTINTWIGFHEYTKFDISYLSLILRKI